ncbi:ATP-binding protein [Xanthomonas campestris]|uniref:ATP-binding protein n=1 Tax=Xanthomonas campestris TaxID=339 RepID=UPI003D6F67E1
MQDWGDGMTEQDFRDGWLIVGRSRKNRANTTRLGRRPAGDKGLGRLSALRMGDSVEVTSVPRKAKSKQLNLSINWARFDRSKTPNEVPLNLRTSVAARGAHPGTRIHITGITKKLEANEIERLNRGLLIVANPFESSNEPFAINLVIEPQPRGLMPRLPDLFNSASFLLNAETDKDGVMSASLADGSGQILATASPTDLDQRFIIHGQGAIAEARIPAKFKMWIYLLRSSEFPEGVKQLNAVRNLLQNFGGVHVFLDEVRVAPYGDPNDDWVGMASMRASNPEFMPQPRTAIGYLTLFDRPELRQKTDRSGFLESPSTDALRGFIRGVLSWQSAVRVGFRDNVEEQALNNAKQDREKLAVELQGIVNGLSDAPKKRATQLVKRLGEVSARQEAVLSREVDLYRALGTAGIASSVFAHEAANNSLARIRSNATAAQYRVAKKDTTLAAQTGPLIDRVTHDVDGLLAVSQITLSLVKAKHRRKQKISLSPVISGVLTLFEPYFELSNVKFEIKNMDKDWALLGSRAAVECVLVNILTNAMQAMEIAGTQSPLIRIEGFSSGNRAVISIADNGPGIQDMPINDIWQPGETTREEGTGLGLTIVKASIRDLGGSIKAEATSELGGARFIITLPLLTKD